MKKLEILFRYNSNGILYGIGRGAFAYDIATHQQLWYQPYSCVQIDGPSIANSLEYLHDCGFNHDEVYALDIKDGSIIWSHPKTKFGSSTPSAFVDNGFVYAPLWVTSGSNSTDP